MARPIKVTDHNKRHNKRLSISREETLERRKLRERFLIATNGSDTEKIYFERIARKMPRDALRQITVDFRNRDPKGLVEYALQKAGQDIYQHVAAVFDKDDFAHFDNAVAKMKAAVGRYEDISIYTAYSNECFELWMLLHFQDVNAPLERERLFDKLQDHVQKIQKQDYKYVKACFPFELLENPGYQQDAVRRAKQILAEAEIRNADKPWIVNPTTEVHILVEKLKEFMYCPKAAQPPPGR